MFVPEQILGNGRLVCPSLSIYNFLEGEATVSGYTDALLDLPSGQLVIPLAVGGGVYR